MRIVVIGDIGVVDDMMHIGDEAMFEALAEQLTDRGAEIVAVSSAPVDSARRYGVGAVSRIGFGGLGRQESERRLAAVLAAADGDRKLSAHDPAQRVIEAIADSDGVVIAGGGDLASTWPVHVYDRVAMTGIARRLGRPVVVSGQTFGPDLSGRDRELVGDIVRSASLVGVREEASLALAGDLGVTARLGVDDASFLGAGADAMAESRAGVLVSLSLHLGGADREQTVRHIARLIDAAADTVGAPAVFHAHFGALSDGATRGDAVLHEEVRAHMLSSSTVLPTGEPRRAAATARSAALLITGRYHPAVFAAPAGVPVLGLVTDRYTDVKQRGALGHWGQSSIVPLSAAGTTGVSGLSALWARRAAIGDEAAARHPSHRRSSTQWWDAVAGVFA